MKTQKHAVVWAEIPVLNFDRAKFFYSEILDHELYVDTIGNDRMGFFPMDSSSRGVGGAIVEGEGYIPSKKGSRIYLNGGDDLNKILERVEPAGGKVIQEKTLIMSDIGYYAVFEDTEGNYVCLHSKK